MGTMFRRKKTSLPSAPADEAGSEASARPEIGLRDIGLPEITRAPEITRDGEPRITPFLGREPRLETVRPPERDLLDARSSKAPIPEAPIPEAPIPDSGHRPQQETRPPMTDKPHSFPPEKTSQPEKPPHQEKTLHQEKTGPSAKPQSQSGPPSPPSRNPLSHLPHIGDPARRPNYPGIPGMERTDRPRPVVEGRKLIVGRDIELTGSIQACDTLVVEGRVKSDITDASVIEVAANGMFHGSAEVDHADIAGTFEGTLTVNKKLSLARTGRIIGTVRYTTLEVEAGGQIQGTMEVLGQEITSPTRLE